MTRPVQRIKLLGTSAMTSLSCHRHGCVWWCPKTDIFTYKHQGSLTWLPWITRLMWITWLPWITWIRIFSCFNYCAFQFFRGGFCCISSCRCCCAAAVVVDHFGQQKKHVLTRLSKDITISSTERERAIAGHISPGPSPSPRSFASPPAPWPLLPDPVLLLSSWMIRIHHHLHQSLPPLRQRALG